MLMEKVKTDKYHLILVVEVRYNKAVCKEKYLFSNCFNYWHFLNSGQDKKTFADSVCVCICILKVFFSFSLFCFLSPEHLHPESSSVDPEMKVKHDLFLYR